MCRHLTRDPRTPGATLFGRGARSSRLIGGAAACQQDIGNQLVTKHGYRLMNAKSRTSAMAKRNQIENAGGDPVANTKVELPSIDSPSLSPATSEVANEPAVVASATLEAASTVSETNNNNKEEPTNIAQASSTRARWLQLRMRPRHRRHIMFAASVAIAGAVGVLAGAAITGGFSKPAPVDVAGLEESKAAQQSIARLSKDVANLRTSLEATNKSAHSQFAKLSERLARDNAEITGTIRSPQAVS